MSLHSSKGMLLWAVVVVGAVVSAGVVLWSETRIMLLAVGSAFMFAAGALVLYSRMIKSSKSSGLAGREKKRLFGTREYLDGLLFFLLVSGPPLFRSRDPQASLRGDIDFVIVLHVVVWSIGGIWVWHQFNRQLLGRQTTIRLGYPQILGLLLVLFLSVSALASVAPALTLFRVSQVLIMILFCFFFVCSYGVESCLRWLFVSVAVLGLMIAVSAMVAPDMVFFGAAHSEYRLRGDLIATTAPVSIVGIILLFTGVRRMSKFWFLMWLVLFLGLLVFSRSRTGIAVFLCVIALAVLQRPMSRTWRIVKYLSIAGGPVIMIVLLVLGLLPDTVTWLIRDPESLSTLSMRIPLWKSLSEMVWEGSPWFGYGYFAASRAYWTHNPEAMATAHSFFVEVLVGGGLLSFASLLMIWFVVGLYAAWVLNHKRDKISFAACSLLGFALAFMLIGGIRPGVVQMTFWSLAAIFPILREGTHNHACQG